MAFKLTPYQAQFQKSLKEEFADQFTQLAQLAEGAADVSAFATELPDAYAEALKSAKTVDQAFDAVVRGSDWGESKYAPPQAATGKKILATPSKAPSPKVAAGAAPATGEPKKRRGNPEALKKAREARNLKSPEQLEAEKTAVNNAMVAYLKEKGGIQPIKPTIVALIETLKANGTNGAPIGEAFIYKTVTDSAKGEGSAFETVQIPESRQRGYKLRG